MKLWTATTDGDNCPLTTTVHRSKVQAERRVQADLEPKILARGFTGDRLRQAWEITYDGACIIQEHEL